MRVGIQILAVVCVFVAPALRAQSADEVLVRMRGAYEGIRDLEARFTQSIRMPLADIEQETRGTITFKKTHRYRVETGDRTIVTDGRTVWSYSATTKQVLVDSFNMDGRTLSPERILLGPPGGFAGTVVGKEELDGSATVVLKLVPQDEGNVFVSVKLWVDRGDWIVRKAEMQDGSGRVTTYRIDRLRVNKGIPDARFVFQAPEGAEVVDLR